MFISIHAILLIFSLLILEIAALDDLRPSFHFLPPKNWMNDPNGPMQYKGIYHLFYQYNPNGPIWGDMHWGHAVSIDLISWKHLPMALYPDKTYDNAGVFSGSATLVDTNHPVLYYTGVSSTETQCYATPANLSDPYLIDWIKSPLNPVISSPPNGQSWTGFRDPTTAWLGSDGNWYMAVGSGSKEVGGEVLLYVSSNLQNWEFVKPLLKATDFDFHQNTNVWECPDFYQLGNSWVVKYSQMSVWRDEWVTGSYIQSNTTFIPSLRGVYDYGSGSYYASKSFKDETGNRILWGWSTENDNTQNWIKRGWAGVQTIPRIIEMDANGVLRMNPVGSLDSLRSNLTQFNQMKVKLNQSIPLAGLYSNQFELITTISNYMAASKFGIRIGVSPDHSEFTSIQFKKANYKQGVDLPGLDYKGVTLTPQSHDPSVCQNYCLKDNFCVAWTYTEPGMMGPNAMCYLKSDLPAWKDNSQCSSGTKPLLEVDRSSSSTKYPVTGNVVQSAPVIEMLTNEPIELRVIYDHSIVEIFINQGKTCLTTRVYPSTTGNQQSIEIFAEGESSSSDIITFDNLKIWQMRNATFTTL